MAVPATHNDVCLRGCSPPRRSYRGGTPRSDQRRTSVERLAARTTCYSVSATCALAHGLGRAPSGAAAWPHAGARRRLRSRRHGRPTGARLRGPSPHRGGWSHLCRGGPPPVGRGPPIGAAAVAAGRRPAAGRRCDGAAQRRGGPVAGRQPAQQVCTTAAVAVTDGGGGGGNWVVPRDGAARRRRRVAHHGAGDAR